MEPFIVTNSSITQFRNCRQRWDINYNKWLSPKIEHIALEDGKIFHGCLEMFYKGHNTPDILKYINKAYNDAVNNSGMTLNADIIEGYEERKAIMVGMFSSYEEQYQQDRINWKIVNLEEQFEVPLEAVDPITNEKVPFLLRGMMDGIIEKNGELWLLEHKTASQIGESYVAKLPMDSQLLTYLMVAQMKLGRPMAGVLYNVVRKPSIRQKKGESREAYILRLKNDYKTRPDFYYYREELKFKQERLENYKQQILRVVPEMWRVKQNPDKFAYQNTAHCTAYGMCPYMDICLAGKMEGPHMQQYRKREAEHMELSGKDKV